MQLEDLDRETLLAVAHEYMLTGLIENRAILPQVALHPRGGPDVLNDVAIDLWMGASPVYTHRMRRLMGITGDDVEAIMKVLQLDVGFVHQYMDVEYRVIDERHGEFWLHHCGALLDAEPHGEEHVFGMCHTIEDPTFDATALATNPRARIRPIHRPPRVPADREPHCHWTITIDPANDPIGPARLTDQVGALPLADVANERRGGSDDDGALDASGPVASRPGLAHWASSTLAAIAREFQLQTHLLSAAAELALVERFGPDDARAMMSTAWVGTSAIVSERLAEVLGGVGPADRLARVLDLQPMVPLGWDRAVEVDGDDVRLSLTAPSELADPGDPGFPGLCASGDSGGLAAMVTGVEPTASVAVTSAEPGSVVVDATIGANQLATRHEPDTIALMRIGMVSSWEFGTED